MQVTELKKRLSNLESSAEENLTNLRTQYENQIENIRKLRHLYEERAEAAARGHEKELEKERAKNTLLEIKLEEHANDAAIIKSLNEKVEELEKLVSEKEKENEELKELRSSLVAECNNLTSQLTLINNLFSNMLTGEMDFDLLTQLLQDNHNLITDLIANGDINDTAALLVNIAEKTYKKQETIQPVSTNTKQEIATNLPKVWRMLIELLSSHEDSIHAVQGTAEECYKQVKLPSGGSRTVISVSQTFLRLKDLILEKNSLVKEVGRLKTLNGHLENRLDHQEKRLTVVSSELKKTWGIVSKLKVQHRQLHTHEKVLRYELQTKRQMLSELKRELEYCRETWDRAREKNKETEHDWEILRKEFALRKSRDNSNSAESGYEDDENSQSPDISTSELEYDLSDSQKSSELHSPSIELEDAASDATVIELIDMLDFEEDHSDPAAGADRSSEPRVPNTDYSEDCSSPSRSPYFSESSEDCSIEDSRSPATPSDQPETSISTNSSQLSQQTTKPKSSEEILEARAARLRRLEQQCRSLFNQMALTSLRSDTLSTRLEELHEQYGSEERRTHVSKTESEQTETPTADPDSRQSRVQQIEQTCMEMLENVSDEAELPARLENIRSSSLEAVVTNEGGDGAGNETQRDNVAINDQSTEQNEQTSLLDDNHHGC